MIRVATLAGVAREMAAEEGGLDRFCRYLKTRGLLPLLPPIVRYLERQAQRERDRERVMIETPFTLSSEARESIRSKIGAPSDAEEKVEENSNLIGGFIAEYNYRRYDASMRRTLEQLRTHLLH
ncbi:MAG: F0F1 ATP synthase subunit delta [Candidatus Paceibacterota bacterium]